jgi:hypothetical protein
MDTDETEGPGSKTEEQEETERTEEFRGCSPHFPGQRLVIIVEPLKPGPNYRQGLCVLRYLMFK